MLVFATVRRFGCENAILGTFSNRLMVSVLVLNRVFCYANHINLLAIAALSQFDRC